MHKIEEPRPSPSFLMDNVEVDINIYYSIAPTSFILSFLNASSLNQFVSGMLSSVDCFAD